MGWENPTEFSPWLGSPFLSTVLYCILYETTQNNSWYDKHSKNVSNFYYYFRGRCVFPIHNISFYVEKAPLGK